MTYDLCDPLIQCNADKIGAEVYEVEVRGRGAGTKFVRVLTFSPERAQVLAEELRPERPSDPQETWF